MVELLDVLVVAVPVGVRVLDDVAVALYTVRTVKDRMVKPYQRS